MNVGSADLIYFSPTQTTKKVIEGIAQGIQPFAVEHYDLTPPAAKTRRVDLRDGLAIIGSPVYSGRLSAEAAARLRQLKANATPAVIIVVYGNRAYEDALLELHDLVLERGFVPVAAGAFIGEHSFSTDAAPIAFGRPDSDDLRRAREFGKVIRDKLGSLRSLDEMPPLKVPGNFPYKERSGLSGVSPVIQEALCDRCEQCIPVCPTAAITKNGTVMLTDPGLCIRCCACVKACPAGARAMIDSRIKQVADLLSRNCRERKEPETYK